MSITLSNEERIMVLEAALHRVEVERDVTRADVKRLVDICELVLIYLEDGAYHTAQDRLCTALAAHQAASGKAVTE